MTPGGMNAHRVADPWDRQPISFFQLSIAASQSLIVIQL
ncbi:hypothetical protein [Azospirillum melinis]